MSCGVTQRIFIDLKPIVSIDEKLHALYEVLSEVEGFENLYWGYNIESLDQVEIWLLWSSPSSQEMYEGTTEQDAVSEILQELSASTPMIHDLAFQPSTTILCAPIVELLLLHSLPASATPSIFDPVVAFIKSTDGCLGVATGKATEEGDEIGNAFLVIVGWESVEANERGATSEGFKSLPKVEGGRVVVQRVRFQRVGEGVRPDALV